MKIKFIAGNPSFSPEPYAIQGETINGFDLSPLQFGGQFMGDDDTKAAGIRDVYRDEQGELHVTLSQATIASKLNQCKSHWRGSAQEIDASAYDPEACYVVPAGAAHLIEGKDYIKVRDMDCAGETGWTIKEVVK